MGYLAAQADLLEELAQLKMLSGLTSSEFTERLAYGALVDGRWRKHVKQVRERLAQAHQFAARELLDLGFELFCEPKGMLLWARHPAVPNGGVRLQGGGARHHAGPGPPVLGGSRTRPLDAFNVAFCTDGVVFAFLRSQGLGAGRPTPASLQRAAATRQTVLPTSSATSSAPRPSSATPTGRP